MVETEWKELLARFAHLELDEFVVMPNHVYGIIVIVTNHPVGAGLVPALDDADTPDWATTRVAPTGGMMTREPILEQPRGLPLRVGIMMRGGF